MARNRLTVNTLTLVFIMCATANAQRIESQTPQCFRELIVKDGQKVRSFKQSALPGRNWNSFQEEPPPYRDFDKSTTRIVKIFDTNKWPKPVFGLTVKNLVNKKVWEWLKNNRRADVSTYLNLTGDPAYDYYSFGGRSYGTKGWK